MSKFGIIKLIAGLLAMGKTFDGKEASGKEIASMQKHKNHLLINGGAAPIPFKVMNQRQKRKLSSQTR